MGWGRGVLGPRRYRIVTGESGLSSNGTPVHPGEPAPVPLRVPRGPREEPSAGWSARATSSRSAAGVRSLTWGLPTRPRRPGNIENMVGWARVPGACGPPAPGRDPRQAGRARPLATTEGRWWPPLPVGWGWSRDWRRARRVTRDELSQHPVLVYAIEGALVAADRRAEPRTVPGPRRDITTHGRLARVEPGCSGGASSCASCSPRAMPSASTWPPTAQSCAARTSPADGGGGATPARPGRGEAPTPGHRGRGRSVVAEATVPGR